MKKVTLSVLTASLLTVSSAQAFDDQREGFLMGIGAGIANVNTTFSSNYEADYSSFGFATSFKMGYGFSNQFLLYYTNDVSWFGIDGANGDNFISGGSSIGASYYFDENSPFYITGSIGLGIFANFTSGDAASGSTFSLGAGYEVTPHVMLEATFQRTSVTDYTEGYDYYDDSTDVATNAFRFTVNYMLY